MEDLLGRLKQAVEQLQGDKVTVRYLADMHGESAHGALLLFLSVLTMLPIPFSGILFSFGIFALAWMMLRGKTEHGLPDMVCRVEIPPAAAEKMIKTLSWIYKMAGKFSRPRMVRLTNAAHNAWLAPFVFAMGFIIFLPIPGGNGAPAAALILVGLGMMAKDGLAILAGLFTGFFAVGMIIFLGWAAVRVLF